MVYQEISWKTQIECKAKKLRRELNNFLNKGEQLFFEEMAPPPSVGGETSIHSFAKILILTKIFESIVLNQSIFYSLGQSSYNASFMQDFYWGKTEVKIPETKYRTDIAIFNSKWEIIFCIEIGVTSAKTGERFIFETNAPVLEVELPGDIPLSEIEQYIFSERILSAKRLIQKLK